MKGIFACLLLAFLPAGAAVSFRGHSQAVTAYDPVQILCTRGAGMIAPWCRQWLKCIQTEAAPAETPAAVMAAWKPANCKEVCGVWPANRGASLMQKANASAALTFLDLHSMVRDDCIESCNNFQKSLSTCVATIMFDQGRVAAMAGPPPAKAPDAICSPNGLQGSPCVPDLPIQHQKCVKHRTAKVLDPGHDIPDEVAQSCKLIASQMDECKDCPQLQGNYQTQYVAFTGGCMDQLNAYWAASNYGVGGEAAIPSEQGCRVHTAAQIKAAAQKKLAEELAAAAAAAAKAAAIAAAKKAAAVAAAKKAAEELAAKKAAEAAAAKKAAEAEAARKAAEVALAKAKAGAKKKAEEALAKKKAEEAAAKKKAEEAAAAKKAADAAAAAAKKKAEEAAAAKKAAEAAAAKKAAEAAKKVAEAAAAVKAAEAKAAAAKPCAKQLAGLPCGQDWAFVTDSKGNLLAIKKGPKTGSGKTEVHRLSAASNYGKFNMQTRTALQLTDKNWDFVMDSKDNLVAILKGPKTGSGKTEVHRLSAASNYLSFDLQVGTGLHYTDENWAFTMDSKDNLVCVLKGPSGSKKTEVHRLTAASNYKDFNLHTATALHYTNAAANKGNWDFAMDPQDNLVCILKGPKSGSGKTEVHKLSAAANYGKFVFQTATALHYTTDDWDFAMVNNDVVAILKGPTSGSCTTEVHKLSGAANYGKFVFQTATGLDLSAATSCAR